MTTITRTEKRQRGIFGWLFLLAFWGFNIIMAVAMFGGLSDTGAEYQALSSDAQRAGFAIGTTIGASILLFIWLAGAVILGLFALLTRGKTVIVERSGE